MATRRGDWMTTFTGRKFWPLDPQEHEVDLKDIAHALSMLCRFGGHTSEFYSVAQHSILVGQQVARQFPEHPDWAFAGLLHDASEAYLQDIIRPIKPFLTNYADIEAKVQSTVDLELGVQINAVGKRAWKAVDTRILVDEANAFMGAPDWVWNIGLPILDGPIHPMGHKEAELRFLNEYASMLKRLVATWTPEAVKLVHGRANGQLGIEAFASSAKQIMPKAEEPAPAAPVHGERRAGTGLSAEARAEIEARQANANSRRGGGSLDRARYAEDVPLLLTALDEAEAALREAQKENERLTIAHKALLAAVAEQGNAVGVKSAVREVVEAGVREPR